MEVSGAGVQNVFWARCSLKIPTQVGIDRLLGGSEVFSSARGSRKRRKGEERMEEGTNKAIADFSAVLEKQLRETQKMLILVPSSMHAIVQHFSMAQKHVVHAQCFGDQHTDIKWQVSLNIFRNQHGCPIPLSCNPGMLNGGWTTSLLRPEFDFLISCDAIESLKHAKIVKFSADCITRDEFYYNDLEKHSVPGDIIVLVLENTKRILHDLYWLLYSRIVGEFEKTAKDNSWPFSHAIGLISAYEELLRKSVFSRERLVESHKELIKIANGLRETRSFAKSETIKNLRERLEIVIENLSQI